MSFCCFLLVDLDPLVDLCLVLAVVGDGGLHEPEADLEVGGGGGEIAVVVTHGRDGFPHVESVADQSGAAAGGVVGEADEGVLVHPQAFLDVALREGARR
jgi:hypothetical protein